MRMNEYAETAYGTALYPGQGTMGGVLYCSLKLNGEAGEVAEKIGKILRDDNGLFSIESLSAIELELGDVLWYIQALAKELQQQNIQLGTPARTSPISLESVATKNIEKVLSRRQRGKVHGSGDNR